MFVHSTANCWPVAEVPLRLWPDALWSLALALELLPCKSACGQFAMPACSMSLSVTTFVARAETARRAASATTSATAGRRPAGS